MSPGEHRLFSRSAVARTPETDPATPERAFTLEHEGEKGVSLLALYQAVRRWILTPPEHRTAVSRALDVDSLRLNILTARHGRANEDLLMNVLDGIAGGAGHGEGRLSVVLETLSRRLRLEGHPGSASLWLELLDRLRPNDPQTALQVALDAQAQGDHERAAAWFSCAIARAGRRVPAVHARAWLGLGRLRANRGHYVQARRALSRALRIAERESLPALVAAAAQDLSALLLEANDLPAACRSACLALGAHPPQERARLVLAFGIAQRWAAQGWTAQALPVLEALRPHAHRLPSPAAYWGALARVTGGMRLGEPFSQAEANLRALAPETVSPWVDLAHGALCLGRWELAGEAVEKAGRISRQRGEGRFRMQLEMLSGHLSSRTAPPPPTPREADQAAIEPFLQAIQEYEPPDASS